MAGYPQWPNYEVDNNILLQDLKNAILGKTFVASDVIYQENDYNFSSTNSSPNTKQVATFNYGGKVNILVYFRIQGLGGWTGCRADLIVNGVSRGIKNFSAPEGKDEVETGLWSEVTIAKGDHVSIKITGYSSDGTKASITCQKIEWKAELVQLEVPTSIMV